MTLQQLKNCIAVAESQGVSLDIEVTVRKVDGIHIPLASEHFLIDRQDQEISRNEDGSWSIQETQPSALVLKQG